MKKEWQKPVLEVLDVNMTMQNLVPGTHLDATFVNGTPVKDLRYS